MGSINNRSYLLNSQESQISKKVGKIGDLSNMQPISLSAHAQVNTWEQEFCVNPKCGKSQPDVNVNVEVN